jgi:DNA-binding protein H-NS
MTQITIDRALVEQVLETIEGLTRDRLFTAEWARVHGATIAALRAALAQPADARATGATVAWSGNGREPRNAVAAQVDSPVIEALHATPASTQSMTQ